MLGAGLRIGLYTPLKKALGADTAEGGGLGLKIAAGMISGSVAAGVCNPTDMVKTRMQTGGAALRSPLAVARVIVAEDGVRGLWKGTTPSMVRGQGALLAAAFFSLLCCQGAALGATLLPSPPGISARPRLLQRPPPACPPALQARAALLTAAQCATYDEVKVLFTRNLGWEDNIWTHLTGERCCRAAKGAEEVG